jgi:hypothetical protein
VGDSFTWGDHVSDWESWPARLEQLSGRKVVNGGVPGYGVDQTFLRLKRLLGRNHFSTVMFSFVPGDIERGEHSVMFNSARPYFDLKDDRLTLENVPLTPFSPPKESGLLSALDESRVFQAFMKRAFPNWWSRHAPSEIQVLDDQRGRQVACALFRELEALIKSQASDLIILFQHYDEEQSTKLAAGEYALSCLSDPATRVLDLRPALLEVKAKNLSKYNRLYIPGDGHMTPEGNDFVAHEIIKFLDQRGNSG